MHIAFIITVAIVLVAFVLGILPRRNVKMDFEQWSVAGRKFGSIFLWILMAGEIYTTSAFLGSAGYAYNNGGPVYYLLGYGTLAYVLSYFLLPPIWRYARQHNLVTQADYFVERFRSPWLGVLVSLIGVAFVIPYGESQLLGLGAIVQFATNNAVPQTWSMIVASILLAVFVYTAGLHSTAWIAVLKDILLIIVILIIGIGLPLSYFGSYSNLFAAVEKAHPHFLSLPGGTKTLGVGWIMSTLVLTSVGFFMWPHGFGAIYSSRSDKVIRQNAIFLPLYQIMLIPIFFVGFTALLVIPGLSANQTNNALLLLVTKTEPPWIIGLVGGAGALTAIVPAGAIVLQASILLARNIYQGVIRVDADTATVYTLARRLVIVLTAITLLFALFLPGALVNLLLTGYDGISQFFPAVVLTLIWPRGVTKAGVVSGLVVGIALVLFLVLEHLDPLWGINAGFIALVTNALVTVLVSVLTNRQSQTAMA